MKQLVKQIIVGLVLQGLLGATQAGEKPVESIVDAIEIRQASLLVGGEPFREPKSLVRGKGIGEADRLQGILHDVYAVIQRRMSSQESLSAAVDILEQRCETPVQVRGHLASALNSEAKRVEENNGVSIRGAYTSSSLSDNNGDADAYLELSWDALSQGYRHNKQRAKILRREAKIESLRAYFKGWSYLDELLVSEQDIELAKQELKYLYTDPYWEDALLESVNPPLIDVAIQDVVAAINANESFTRLSRLEKQHIVDKNKQYRNNRLRLFLRKEFDVSSDNQDGVVAGLRFTIPLERTNREFLSHRLNHQDEKAGMQQWETIIRARTAFESLREQKQRVIKQQYRYLRSDERMRRAFARMGLGQELELAAAVARVRSLLDASIELVRAKEELYRRVNEIFLVSRVEFSPEFIRLEKVRASGSRARIGDRSIYIWSTAFNAYSNKVIIDFMRAKDIRRVLLSVGKKTDRVKLKAFIAVAAEHNIILETIIGSNNWIWSENHDKASISIAAAAEITGTVHLDIEPHTMEGYKQDKQVYLKNYLQMLRKARKLTPDRMITVAVPFHWPEAVYQEIASLTDRIYIMAYGTNKIATIAKRIVKLFSSIPHEKCVVVLRDSDFDDEWHLEKSIEVLNRQTGASSFGIHKFRTFLSKAGDRQ